MTARQLVFVCLICVGFATAGCSSPASTTPASQEIPGTKFKQTKGEILEAPPPPPGAKKKKQL